MKQAILALAVLVAMGCASVPNIRYYTLDMTPSGKAQPRCNLKVERLRPSDALARKDILIKKSPTEIEYYALDQWAANLGEVVSEKLTSEFGPIVQGRKTLLIAGVIQGFEQVDTADGAAGHIKLDLAFRPEGESRYEPPLLEKVYETSVAAERASPTAVVRALSRGLERLAGEIADDAGKL